MTRPSRSWNELLSHKRHEVRFGDVAVIVEDGVFTPDPNITYSTAMIVDNLPSLNGLRVADIGTGSGIIAVIAALRGADNVIATDTSDISVQNAAKNISLNGVVNRVEIFKTNLLDGISGKFDLICANLPILDELWMGNGEVSAKSTAETFLKQASSFLNYGGMIYITSASFVEKEIVESLLKKYHYNFNIISTEKLGYVWYLYIATISS